MYSNLQRIENAVEGHFYNKTIISELRNIIMKIPRISFLSSHLFKEENEAVGVKNYNKLHLALTHV